MIGTSSHDPSADSPPLLFDPFDLLASRQVRLRGHSCKSSGSIADSWGDGLFSPRGPNEQTWVSPTPGALANFAMAPNLKSIRHYVRRRSTPLMAPTAIAPNLIGSTIDKLVALNQPISGYDANAWDETRMRPG